MQQTDRPVDFRLRKAYLDCVAPDGTVVIAYSGSVQWKSFSAGMSNVTRFDTLGRAHSRWAGSSFEVVRHGSTLRWSAAPLACEIDLQPRTDAFETRLFESEAGSIDWSCQAPAADVTVEVEGERIEGSGYAESIEMTIAPWALPLDALHWGRFVGDGESLVWIEWHGPHPLSLAWHNGECKRITSLDVGGLELDSGEALRHGRSRSLRSGTLERLLAPAGALLAHLPIGSIHEAKWVSAAQLEVSGRAVHGWAIHEEVRFR